MSAPTPAPDSPHESIAASSPPAVAATPSPTSRLAWLSFLLRAALLAAAIELVRAAESRVVVAASSDSLPSAWWGPLLNALMLTVVATLALIALDALLGLGLAALNRWRPGRPDSSESRSEAAWLLLLAFLAPYLLTELYFNIRHLNVQVALPMFSGRVSELIPWLVVGLGFEVVLRVVRLWRGAPWGWWLARALLGLGWALVLLKLMTGPDILRGDPIEWAMRLKDPALSQAWLARGPAAPARWWPLVQLGSAIGLFVTLAAALRELWQAARLWRQRPRRRPGVQQPTAEREPA